VTSAFMSGLHRGCLVGSVAAVAAAILVLTRLPQARETKEVAPLAHV
jgi:hypothetical protein